MRAVLGHTHRLDDFDIAARQRARGEPGLIDRVDEGAALPSMIGTSGPSISTTTLSTLSPRNAASRCSAVEQSGPLASPSTVANSVAVTARTSARISRSVVPSAETRWKTMPVSSSAGCNVSVTGLPECTPMPETATWSRNVVCLAPFIVPVYAGSQAVRPIPTPMRGPHFSLQVSSYLRSGRRPQGSKSPFCA